jgi:predicted NUDIX family NTP pyrophosphohydrolase
VTESAGPTPVGRAAKRSAGIVLFRRTKPSGGDSPANDFEVLLGHTGGPLWARRDSRAWSIPKGEYAPSEPALAAARREFTEELGFAPPAGELIPLGEITQRGGKIVTAWALQAQPGEPSLEPAAVAAALAARSSASGAMFSMEWPRGSGVLVEFAEIDRVEWFSPSEAADRLFSGQAEFLQRLAEQLSRGPRAG